ncbi:MAG: hypothetical protein NVS2B11_10030 [Acetobacteraceae bacterium]
MLDVDAEAPELRALASHYAQRGGALWVAGKADGMSATAPLRAECWEICRVYVRPGLHGGGLGHALLDRAEAHAVASGARELVLWTDTRFRRAHRFYEARSFVRDGPVRALHDIAGTIEYRYAKPVNGVRQLDIAAAQSAERRLAGLLRAAVAAGTDGPFLNPLAPDRAQAFWQGVTRRVGEGNAQLFASWSDGALSGATQVELKMNETGQHRAKLTPPLLHPGARPGLAATLLHQAETAAASLGRTLLVLETAPGSANDRLARSAGWTEAGRIEGYTRHSGVGTQAMTILIKQVGACPGIGMSASLG